MPVTCCSRPPPVYGHLGLLAVDPHTSWEPPPSQDAVRRAHATGTRRAEPRATHPCAHAPWRACRAPLGHFLSPIAPYPSTCRAASPRSPPVARRRPLPRRAEPPPPLLCRSTAELAVHPFPSSSPTSTSPPALREHRRTVTRPPDSTVAAQARLQSAVSDRRGASARRGRLRSGFRP
jgi:hypothetical protein